jgi:eukaryotic-like serine/threonine-protein kinase
MVLLSGPAEFLMGSPPAEIGRSKYEQQHKKRIGRTFALAAKPVTVAEYTRFKEVYRPLEVYARMADSPATEMSWYEAAAYCNWLSKEDGIQESQWCYEIKGQVTKLRENYLSLKGYRLPTETEVEYATRAEGLTSRYYGETDELLPKHGWYDDNSRNHIRPVGSLKPNDFGLFAMHGNVWTWCQDRYKLYPTAKVEKIFDDREGDELAVKDTDNRVLRGGAYYLSASHVRSAYRYLSRPTNRGSDFGFRLARTFTP